MFTIRKKFKFEMSHILDSSFSKDCQKMHGHSYILEVFVQSPTLNEDGMVVDFGLVKEVVKPIVDRFDHACLVSTANPFVGSLQTIPGFLGVPYNPTAENMAQSIFHEIWPALPQLNKIRLHETDTGYVEYSDSEV